MNLFGGDFSRPPKKVFIYLLRHFFFFDDQSQDGEGMQDHQIVLEIERERGGRTFRRSGRYVHTVRTLGRSSQAFGGRPTYIISSRKEGRVNSIELRILKRCCLLLGSPLAASLGPMQ